MFSLARSRATPAVHFSGEVPSWLVGAALAMLAVTVITGPLFAPLWLDESFSATIASQPGPHGLISWCLNELSGPFYYSMLWAWQKLAGSGNLVLRIPSVVGVVAAPAFLFWRGHPDRLVRALWALAVALWPLQMLLANYARPYALMVLFGCVQAACFLRLMAAPDTRRATIWAAVSVLAILTHYHALVISGVQGLLYLAIWRTTAFKTWRAALVLVPLLAWMAIHLSVVLGYASLGKTWYSLLGWRDLVALPLFFTGSMALTLVLAILVPASIAVAWSRARARHERFVRWSPEAAVIASGVIAIAIVAGIGAFHPSFTVRYLLPYLGAVSLIVPMVARALRPSAPMVPLALALVLVCSALPALAQHLARPFAVSEQVFGFEEASDWIMAHSAARRVVLEWDNPIVIDAKPDRLAEVGEYVFKRAGHPVTVLIPRYRVESDPYPAVRALAGTRGDTAVIWAYVKTLPHTSAQRFEPGVLTDRGRWQCQRFGSESSAVLACIPPAKAP